MAFEVARVHRLICSRVGDEGDFQGFKTSNHSVGTDQISSQTCSPQSAELHNCPVDLCHNLRGFDQGFETSNLPLESSSCSTETESDEDDGLLESLAQQIAHSMLDEDEANAELCAGVLKGKVFTESQSLSNVEANEGRVSPSSWSSGSWSSGPLLSGSRSSSKGSSRGSSQVSSPSSAPSSGYQDAWDTLYAAAGEVVRLKMNEEKVPVFSSERSSHTKILNQGLRAHLPHQTRTSGHMSGRSSSSHSARRKEENLKASSQAQQNWASKCAAMAAMAGQSRSHGTQYQQQQQAFSVGGQQGVNTFCHSGKFRDSKTVQRSRQSAVIGGSGMRVVFLGSPSGRESSGTGVFLPRSLGSAVEPKKKMEVSPMCVPMRGYVTGAPHIGSGKAPREGVWPTLQQSINRSRPRQTVVHEPCLPTEWTY